MESTLAASLLHFPTPLIEGRILNRYKRFFADVELPSGTIITAHVPNTGSMQGCWAPQWTVLLSHNPSPKRKLSYTLEMTRSPYDHSWIGVNTQHTNRLFLHALENKIIPEFSSPYPHLIEREASIDEGKSKIDFLLDKKTYIEVKNVTLSLTPGLAQFPDAVSTRGQKHLSNLIQLHQQGFDAYIFFVIQRENINLFSPATHIDATYGDLLRKAQKSGVKILAYVCNLSPLGIGLSHPVEVDLS